MIISIFTSPSTLWITISTRARTPQLVCILRNIGLLELQSIVCQIHIEKESDVWFGRHSQWLAQLADLPRQPFGLVFSLRSMQTSWGVLDTHLINKLTNSYYSVCGAGLPTSADQSIRPSIGIQKNPISINGILFVIVRQVKFSWSPKYEHKYAHK